MLSKRLPWVGIALVYAAFVGVAAFLIWGPPDTPWAKQPPLPPGVPAPPQAALYANALTYPDLNVRRAAVGPYEAADPPEYPAGSVVTIDADGWRERQDFAVATATITGPGFPTHRLVFGFQKFGTVWRIVFVENWDSFEEGQKWLPAHVALRAG